MNYARIHSHFQEKDPFIRLYQIEQTLTSQDYSPHKSKYSELIAQLDHQYASSHPAGILRRAQCALLSALLLRIRATEINKRFISLQTGTLIHEDPEDKELYDSLTYQLFNHIEEFCAQSSADSSYEERLWINLYLIQSLFTIFTDCKDLNILDKNCDGLYPLFRDISAVNSEYLFQYSTIYTPGFLYLPVNAPNVWEYFPALVHEIHHYIPTLSRKVRNKAIFYLSLLSVLKSSINIELCQATPRVHELFYKFANELCDKLYDPFEAYSKGIPWYSGNSDDVEVDLNNDSMSFAENMREYIFMLDFHSAYKEILSKQDTPLSFLDSVKCVEFWEQNAINYLHTYIAFFREIHSDLCMVNLLDMSLEEYISYMSSQKTFIRLSAQMVASSSITRFCVITRYLYASETHGVV